MEQLSLEALKAQEADLLRELESKNSEKSNILQKHRQVLLNAAHFLRLYHQSSKDAVEILENLNVKAETETKASNNNSIDKESVIRDILSKNGLRLMWDALRNSEFLRAALILQYLRNIFDNNESFDYFESDLMEVVINYVTSEQEESEMVSNAFTAMSIFPFNFLDHFKTKPIEVFVILFKNMKKSDPINSPIRIFIEKESNYCEFKELKDVLVNPPSCIEFMNNLKTEIKEYLTSHLQENIKSIDNVDVLNQLELDETTIASIIVKLNALKLQKNSEKLKNELAEFFDRLMKSIQTSIRSNEIKIDDFILQKIDSISGILKETADFPVDLMAKFQQITTNKSNIIFTIHRNELSALNQKAQIPLGSRLYLAVKLIDELDLPSELRREIDILSSKFFITWIEDVSATFKQFKNDNNNNELIALIWLSNHLLSLQAPSHAILKSLNIDELEIKTKYQNQIGLLAGIIEAEKISTPRLTQTDYEVKNDVLIPHFIPK